MIRNIVFDIGMVLVDFRWKSLMEELGFTGDRLEGAARATVLGPYWKNLTAARNPERRSVSYAVSTLPGV